jgi:hypothetical protein
MKEPDVASALEALSEDVFGVSLPTERFEVIARALGEVLAEVKKLRSLDLSDIDPVVIFDPLKAPW